MTKCHKIFVSYHHENDEYYRNKLEKMCKGISVSRSVDFGDIDPRLSTETIRRKIRDNYLRDSTVTVVLVGEETWKRKHVDWEIGSSIRGTEFNPRSGLVGILLPSYRRPEPDGFYPYDIPPRLYFNYECEYAEIYEWSNNPNHVEDWVHEAFLRRKKIRPDNSYPSFKKNRSGERWW